MKLSALLIDLCLRCFCPTDSGSCDSQSKAAKGEAAKSKDLRGAALKVKAREFYESA